MHAGQQGHPQELELALCDSRWLFKAGGCSGGVSALKEVTWWGQMRSRDLASVTEDEGNCRELKVKCHECS